MNDKYRARIAKGIKIDQTTGCWEWKGKPRENGYCRTSFNYKSWYVHRMAYQLFVGEIPEGNDVCHRCDNRRCCNPAHLFVGTRKDNMDDCVSKNRQASGEILSKNVRGEKSHLSKLTSENVIEIRKMKERGDSTAKIAKLFSVSKDNIRSIVRRDTWRHI